MKLLTHANLDTNFVSLCISCDYFSFRFLSFPVHKFKEQSTKNIVAYFEALLIKHTHAQHTRAIIRQ